MMFRLGFKKLMDPLADKIMIGPFDVAYDTGEPATTMPSTPVPINHWEFFIGLGIHL